MMFTKTRAKFFNWLVKAAQAANEPADCNKDQIKDIPAMPGLGSSGYGYPSNIKNSAQSTRAVREDMNSKRINLTVFPGRGGMAVEINRYDQASDSQINRLHIIPDGEDLAEALAHIITYESL